LTITVEPPEAGFVNATPDKIAYTQGERVSLLARAFLDYTFQGWEGAVTATESRISVPMDGDKAVIARFNPPRALTVIIDPPGSGTVTLTPAGSTFRHGQQVVLTATPISSTFSGWSGGATGTDATVTVTMNADTTVTANLIVPP
jgi:hypothetical protein